MSNKIINLGSIEIANDKPFVLFGGMNVLESRDLAMSIAETYAEVTQKLGIPYVFKPPLIRRIALLSILTVVQVWRRG